MKRDLDYENELFAMEESVYVNALYLHFLLKEIGPCTLRTLANALYLFRFSKITLSLLKKNEAAALRRSMPEWEFENLDNMLIPYIVERFDSRFIGGVKELIVRKLAYLEEDVLILNPTYEMIFAKIPVRKRITVKVKYVTKVIQRYSFDELHLKITKLVGEERWKTQSL
ncbi:hypothetical protein CBW65_19565 [Tumebacillus avium]|uniref:Uncharacterized protein n=1 Tax=Tumebacillus avium TaxID=1903704 RepID=A0A1Y0IU79_9BACL|nr:hypothetical protein [Tumebacillus avium]ARU62933.1 hypothetical protein CBW65_19565 [Tumebacillus avium]